MALPTSEPPLNTAKAYPDPALNPPALSIPTPLPDGAPAPAQRPPVRRISSEALRTLGQRFNQIFQQYVSDRRIVEHIPAARWGEAADLMGAVVFLASRASDYVNGHVLVVDGGYLVR